jgi:hypothetical protein
LQVSRTLAGRSRTLGEKALFQGLEPGVGVVGSRRRPVATSGEVGRSVSEVLISHALHAEGLSHKVLERLAKQRNDTMRAHCREALQVMAKAGDLDDALIIDESGQVWCPTQ